MAKRLVAKEIKGLDPDTGELIFTYDEVDDDKPEPTPEQQAAAQKNFDGGDPVKALERYRAVQGWATKVHQKNLELEQRLASLETKANAAPPRQVTELPTANDPGAPDLDSVLSDPNAFRTFVAETVKSHLGLVGAYVREQLQPLQPVLTAYNTHNELQSALARHADFPHWQPEMLEISKGLKDDQEMTLEELYYEARKLNPTKAMQIDSGQYKPPTQGNEDTQPAETEEQGKPKLQPATSATSAAPGTETQAPGTQQVPAQVAPTYDPGAPVKGKPFVDGQTATAEELRTLAARHTTETGVADGTAPEATHQGIDAALEGAWAEVTGGGS